MGLNQRKNKDVSPVVIQRLKTSENEISSTNVWVLTPVTGFKLLLSMRLVSALWSNISDCDETYNYWEPTHYLIFGNGFQTWEYSPSYALRSYLYLWIHTIFAILYNYFQSNKILLFYAIRCLLAFFGAYADLSLYKGLLARFSAHQRVAAAYFWITLLSPGMFIASSAYLPSTFAMSLLTFAYGIWWQMSPDLLRQVLQSEIYSNKKKDYVDKYESQDIALKSKEDKKKATKIVSNQIPDESSPLWPITLVAAAGVIGWPFAALVGVPMAIEIIFVHKYGWTFIKWCCIALLFTLVPTMLCDTIYYGKLVVTPLNLITYNVFSDHGPDIYGVEPWQYYFVNLFLNYNVAFIGAFMSALLMMSSLVLTYATKKELNYGNIRKIGLTLAPFYLWILVFFTRPHKEERFMFPIFAFLAANAAIGVEYLAGILSFLCTSLKVISRHRTATYFYVAFAFFNLFIPLSVFRLLALVKNYHSGIDLYAHLYSEGERMFYASLPTQIDLETVYMGDKPRTVCVGKDWYRFPSHFFLPQGWMMHFIQSEFRGQLPKHFDQGPRATSIIPTHMNDMNQEESTRYIDIAKCDILVDIALNHETALEPNYSLNGSQWYIESSYPYLDNQRSNPFHRAFHLPYLSPYYLVFNKYNILINRSRMNRRKRVKRT